MYRFRVEYLKQKECYPQLLEEHQQMIKMIESHQKKEARAIAGRHIDNQAVSVSDALREKKE